MISDEDATPEQIEQHLVRLRRLLHRSQYAEDWETERWVSHAVERCEKLLSRLQPKL